MEEALKLMDDLINRIENGDNLKQHVHHKREHSLNYPRIPSQTFGITMTLVRNKKTNKYLGINETSPSGWYIPNGPIELGETYLEAANRQCKLQSNGMNISIKGLLRVEHSATYDEKNGLSRMRVIYYGEYLNDNDDDNKEDLNKNKTKVRWFDVNEFEDLVSNNKINARGHSLAEWGDYINNNGNIYSLDLFDCNDKQNLIEIINNNIEQINELIPNKNGISQYNQVQIIIKNSKSKYLVKKYENEKNNNKDGLYGLVGDEILPMESFIKDAQMLCTDHCGLKISIKGVISISHYPYKKEAAAMKVVFYGEPLTNEDETEHPLYAGYEWLSSSDCMKKGDDELAGFVKYLDINNQEIYPMNVLTEEHAEITDPKGLEHIRNHNYVNLLKV